MAAPKKTPQQKAVEEISKGIDQLVTALEAVKSKLDTETNFNFQQVADLATELAALNDRVSVLATATDERYTFWGEVGGSLDSLSYELERTAKDLAKAIKLPISQLRAGRS